MTDDLPLACPEHLPRLKLVVDVRSRVHGCAKWSARALWGGKETVFPRTGYLFRSEYRSVRALVVLKANIPLERSSALLLHASPITGTSSIAYLEESLKALTVELTAERLSELGG